MNAVQRKQKDLRRLERRADKLKYDAQVEAVNILLVLPVYILGFKFGWGNKRLFSFINLLHSYTEWMAKDKSVLNKMVDDIETFKGIKINSDGGVKNLKE